MLFNSYIFIFVFLPVTLLGFYGLGKLANHRASIAFLVGASLFFYGWWNPSYLGLIVASILFNFRVGMALNKGHEQGRQRRGILWLGVVANLALLGYYKYANFFVENLNLVAGTDFHPGTILLPLAISFFTFQQVAFLVDSYRGETHEYNFLHYCLFVTFFPQLIAGPIVHHRDMFPQFCRDVTYRFGLEKLAIGLAIFTVGLFKKVVIADTIAVYSSAMFDATLTGAVPSTSAAWCGAAAYTFQLYFDFSGYSDMAVGLATMFGIRLPINFFSPLKSASIIDFWRRWHMTLSQFLKEYLYFPLGGNRAGKARRHINILITMLLGGLWHGASWNFVIWGGLHGLYIVINHLWAGLRRTPLLAWLPTSLWLGRSITLVAVIVAFVFFRAESLDSAVVIVSAMFLGGAAPTAAIPAPDMQLLALLAALLVLVWGLPNTWQMFANYEPTSIICLSRVSEFLYFQF